MKVLSYNLLCYGRGVHAFENRFSDVIQKIKDEDPDIFGVQEATPEWMENLRADFGCCYTSIGIGRDENGKGEHSAIFYKTSSYKLVDSGTFWLSETPDRVSHGWDGACKRICTFAVLNDKMTGNDFAFLNTHLDHVGPVAMLKGNEMVISKANSFSLPVVITGDFNNTPNSAVYRNMIEAGFIDSRYAAPDLTDTGTFTGFDKDKSKWVIIDYIFSRDFTVNSFHVNCVPCDNGEFASDHNPVVAELSFKTE